jgi:hypothetical protein
MLPRLRLLLGRRAKPAAGDARKLENWYAVEWDEERIYRHVSAPGKEPWADSLAWKDVTRICFKAEVPELSDGIYLFTDRRLESYVIPTEAKGGSELWLEILRRRLFDAELAIEAASAVEGLFCWPKDEEPANNGLEAAR